MSLDKIFRPEIIDIAPYKLEVTTGVKLNQNEAPWDIPVELKTQIIQAWLKEPWNRYPEPNLLPLKKKMSKYLNVWPDSLTFANGSNVLIQALILATSLKQKILVPDPCFSVYEFQGKILENTIIRFPLEDDFSINEEKFLETIVKEKPRLIFFPNPHAPTGKLFSLDFIKSMLKASGSGLVVIDEAYYPFSGTTAMGWLKEYDNLVILRTFSKAFALAGVRLGWMVADPEVIAQVQKCLLPFCVSQLSCVLATLLLDHTEYMDQFGKQIVAERERVYESLRQIEGLKVYPSHANFILMEHPKSKALFKQLSDSGVLIRNVSDGRRLTQALRVTIGTKKENDTFLKEMSRACDNL